MIDPHKYLSIQAVLSPWTGFGQIVQETIAGLSMRGWNVEVKPILIDRDVPWETRRKMRPQPAADWELTIASIAEPQVPTPGKKAIYWTMWEKDHLSRWQSQMLNRCKAVMVPNEWVAAVFAKTVSVPIHVVPLGIHPTIFCPSPVSPSGPCVFGAGGDLSASAARKNLDAVIRAFYAAFTRVPDVELRLKVVPGRTKLDTGPGPIHVNDARLSWADMARWYRDLTAFVNVGTEGWGLMPHQAMACGRPAISPLYGGVTAFMTRENGYPVDYTLEWCDMGNRNVGAFAEIDEQSLAAEMQRVFLDREEVAEKGVLATKSAQALTWDNSIDVLEETLGKIIQA